MADEPAAHHPVFLRFAHESSGFTDWLGVHTSRDFSPDFASWPLYVWPAEWMMNEEYIEFIDLLEAVIAAKGTFTMIELGAGYGRWTVRAAAAARLWGNLRYRLIAVEPEPTHFRWLRRHCRENGIRRRDRHGTCRLIRAAISARRGRVPFHVGGKTSGWYGHKIAAESDVVPDDTRLVKVRSVTLRRLLRPLDVVDLVDMDVQGLELAVLASATKQLDRKVKRVHVETHTAEIEDGIRELFGELGWKSVHDYPLHTLANTPWGQIAFQGGVQSWINPRLA